MNQGNEQNQHIYFTTIFSFPLSKILVQLLPCKDESKDGIKFNLPWMYSRDLELQSQ